MSLPLFLYENRFKDATPAASTTAAGFSVLNLRDWRPYTWWKPTALPATVTVDCASAKAADYAVVWGHDLFTQGATFEVRGSTDNFAASDVSVATKTPTSDDPFVLTWTSVSYRYWRIRITGTTMPSLAIAVVGAKLEVPVGLAYGFQPRGRKIHGDFNQTNKGHPLGKAIDFEEWKRSLNFKLLASSWIRNSWEPAWKAHLRSSPFVFAWDVGNYPGDIYLVVAGDGYDDPGVTPTLSDLSLDVSGVVP